MKTSKTLDEHANEPAVAAVDAVAPSANTPSDARGVSLANATVQTDKLTNHNQQTPLKTPTCHDSILAHIAANTFQLADSHLVVRIDIQQQYGSIILPESAQNERDTATIIHRAANLNADDFPIGAHILPVSSAGRELAEQGTSRLVLYALEDLIAIFVDDE